MNEELIKIQKKAEQFHQKSADKIIPLYPGIDLCYLDFSLHTLNVCTDSVITFPNNMYQELTICIDLPKTSGNPPELLKNSKIFDTIIPKKYCQNDSPVFLAGNNQTESIFSAFYEQPENLELPYLSGLP